MNNLPDTFQVSGFLFYKNIPQYREVLLSLNSIANLFPHPGKVKGFMHGLRYLFQWLSLSKPPLTRIRSAQWCFGSKLIGEPDALKNPPGSGDLKCKQIYLLHANCLIQHCVK